MSIINSTDPDNKDAELSSVPCRRLGSKQKRLKYLAYSTLAYVTCSLSEAQAFSAPYIAKMRDAQTHLVTGGLIAVGVALTIALIQGLGGRGINWKWVGTIAGIGIALTSIGNLISYITT